MKQHNLHLPLAILAELIVYGIMHMTDMCKIIVQITEQHQQQINETNLFPTYKVFVKSMQQTTEQFELSK